MLIRELNPVAMELRPHSCTAMNGSRWLAQRHLLLCGWLAEGTSIVP